MSEPPKNLIPYLSYSTIGAITMAENLGVALAKLSLMERHELDEVIQVFSGYKPAENDEKVHIVAHNYFMLALLAFRNDS